MHWLHKLVFCAKQALSNIVQRPLQNILAIGVMAVGLWLSGIALWFAFNVSAMTASWGEGVSLSVYLDSNFAPAQLTSLKTMLRQREEVLSLKHIPSAQALSDLKHALGSEAESWLSDQQAGLLPETLDLQLKSAVSEAELKPLIASLSAMRGILEVEYRGAWAARLGRFASLLRSGAFFFALLLCLSMVYLVASTIRIAAFDRQDEVSIQRLLGATGAFIRLPFLIEGILHGIFGALIAFLALYALHHSVLPYLQPVLRELLVSYQVTFFSFGQLLLGAVVAAGLGFLGSAIALNRYVQR